MRGKDDYDLSLRHVKFEMLVRNSSGDDKRLDRYMYPTLTGLGLRQQGNTEHRDSEQRHSSVSPGRSLEKMGAFNSEVRNRWMCE